MSSGWATMQRARLMRRSSGPVKSFRGANLSLAACLVEQLASAGECLGRDASAHHPGELRGALVVGAQLAHRHDVAPIRARGFLDYEVVVGERSDLGQVRHDQYLPLGAESLQAQADLDGGLARSEEHTSELQSRLHLVCRLLLEKKKHGKPLLDLGIGEASIGLLID